MPKTSQKRPKNGQISKKKIIIFLARNYLKKLIQWAQTAKNGFKCFKMHSNANSPKRAKKCQKNGKKWQIMSENDK